MSEDTGARRRSSARRSFSEHTLPTDYLERLEQKRKQLDESIHKYIAAKEREYKQFERDLKQEHKLSQGQDPPGVHHNANAHPAGEPDQNAALAAQRIAAVDALSNSPSRRQQASSALANSAVGGSPSALLDPQTAKQREKYLEGLFTPAYLIALDDQGKRRSDRAFSEPNLPSTLDPPPPSSDPLERANSDSFEQAKLKRPSQLVLAQRTSSSGSSADGKLASAMRSPTHRPKQKRVSLAVGDSIVAPSDNVPAALTQNTTPSHSRKRSQVPEREYPLSQKRLSAEGNDHLMSAARALSPLVDEVVFAATDVHEDGSLLLPPVSVDSGLKGASESQATLTSIDPDGDLFDLEDENLYEPRGQADAEDSDNAAEQDNDMISGRVESVEQPTSPPASGIARTRYDPSTGVIPEPEPEDEREDSAVPYLAFGPRTASAPLEPGFRRPSVVDDPIYLGADYQAAERSAVENDVYGSSANRPASKGSFTAGSLGESYMAQHAEEMMRSRLAKRSTPVGS